MAESVFLSFEIRWIDPAQRVGLIISYCWCYGCWQWRRSENENRNGIENSNRYGETEWKRERERERERGVSAADQLTTYRAAFIGSTIEPIDRFGVNNFSSRVFYVPRIA